MKGFIFDLDGTLLDSMGIWEGIDRQMLAKRGIPFPEEKYHEFVAITTPLSPAESAAFAIKHYGISATVEEIIQEWSGAAEEAYAKSVPMKPGAKAFLEALRAKGTKMAVATSSPTNLCIPALQNHGIIDLFDAVCLSDEVGVGKTKPDVFLLAAKRLGVEPGDCIVFEDSLTAMKTAKSVGMTICAILDPSAKNLWPEIEQVADSVILDFSEVKP